MFTGIIIDTGEVVYASSHRLTVSTPRLFKELEIGRSIAVNGVCLTIIELTPASESFSAELSPETLARTNLGLLRRGDLVNLELPLRLSDRLDGHFVLGHVDTVGEVVSISRKEKGAVFRFRVDARYSPYLIEKGSIALDGISLTIFNIRNGEFDVAVIPHTLEQTNLRTRRPGDKINVEFDVLGKYIEKLFQDKGGQRDGLC
ncbi:MAG: riboflavin synthase [Candidatus Bipolaricaulota bacterium]|nr:riboflavin synthase [Candidatus Bipolaricaulota bacterium]MDW8031180.1 riboflavin synthase [Candidatus Bipolaricaulota bacterium]